MEGKDIPCHTNFDWHGSHDGALSTLLIGGFHGDEKATVPLLENFLETDLTPGILTSPVAIIPLLNPDGYIRDTRYNARGVDLNRNFDANWIKDGGEPGGRYPLSEPESRALRDLILEMRPAKIISLHWALSEIDPDGPQSEGLALSMWQSLTLDERGPYRLRRPVSQNTDIPSESWEAHPICPGSLGQWCGYGRPFDSPVAPAVITLELPYDPTLKKRPAPLPDNHLEKLRELWKRDPSHYLHLVQPGLNKMLTSACLFHMEPNGAAGVRRE